mmetsp:Transcript_1466/g.2508  ORF Transcript_1466/g.2508 Transcript_1466/m.2508 type:complete len:102 (-) Transcript_1466:278-583(-)
MRKILPSPGEGHSAKELAKGYCKVAGVGTGTKGAKVFSDFKCPADAGYEMTGRTIVEAGLTLAIGNQDNIKAGGVLTPAACMGKELLKRLKENADITLDIH